MKLITTILTITTLFSVVSAQTLSIKGSDTLGAKLVPQLAESFRSAGNSDVKFEIAAEGSTTAFPALANGTAQIGMSSREVKEEESTFCKTKGVYLKEHLICYDMLVIILNRNSPLTALTKAQVAKIFTGQIKDWSEIGGGSGPISIYTRNTSSGTYKDWQKLAMGGRDYPSSSLKMAGNEQISQEVAKNKNGIGYVGLAFAKAKDIKAIKIDDIQPIAQNAKKYAYSRPCFLYVPDKMTPEATSFMSFVESAAGQEIVRNVGFIPMADL
jgi:phosphate transport system substrate-binding protein